MNEFQRIFRVYTAITAFFIAVSSALVSGVVYLHASQFRLEARSAQHQLLQSHIDGEYTALAEETYLKLDTLRLHQTHLQDAIGDKGDVTLAIDRSAKPPAGTGARQPPGAWMSSSDGADDTFAAPLFFGQKYLGSVQAKVHWEDDRSGTLPYYLGTVIGAMIGLWIIIIVQLKRRVHAPLLRNVIDLQRSAAITQTTQMLAHDIRKPFTMLRAVLNIIQHTQDPDRVRAVAAQSGPELTRAINHVNHMLADILEVGSASAPRVEEIELHDVLSRCLSDVFTYARKADIEFTYSLRHTKRLLIDPIKLSRALDNIVLNAAQAMEWKGRIWFKSEDVAGKAGAPDRLRLAVGNTGTVIAAVDIKQIFDTFFTKNKRGGTGLGLAIAKKVVAAHGGDIHCTSSTEDGTEFLLTLPVAVIHCAAPAALPSSSAELFHAAHARHDAQKVGASPGVDSPDKRVRRVEDAIEESLKLFSRQTSRLFRVVIVDDESVYGRTVVAELERLPNHASLLDVHVAEDVDSFRRVLSQGPCDLAIIDVDLGSESTVDGYDLAAEVRNESQEAYICLHSNRDPSGGEAATFRAGANLFLAKPMTSPQMLALLRNALLPKADTRGVA